jgi:dolichol-phosphate mannosyltransferase
MPSELSVVVPCFNEEEVIYDFHFRMSRACCELVGEDGYEIVFVNDGSTDDTPQKLEAIARSDPRVVYVDLFRNHGHQLAVSAGLQYARGARVMLIDADLQDPPELLAAFAGRMDEGYDVVYGRRASRQGETWFKKASAALFYRALAAISSVPIPPDTGDFRLMSRDVVDQLNRMPEQDRFIRGMVAWIGGRQSELLYDRAPRHAGKTKYNLAKMVALAVDATTGFSVAPLRLATIMSFVTIAVAVALAFYVILSYAYLQTAPGWASLGVILLAFSAVQLFCIGILGEYVGRTFMQSKGRPRAIVRRIVRQGSARRDENELSGKTEQAPGLSSSTAESGTSGAGAETPSELA